MKCAACGHDNPDRAKFCLECGANFARSCAHCATELPAGAKFCLECGTAVEAGAARAARAPADYTPRHLVDKILQSRSALEGERKRVTVLFADVKGSMELAEKLDPEAWHAILDGFFQILSDGVHRFEGTVNQYTGDGIMALFGAPLAHEDHAQRGCYAALHLIDALRRHALDVRRRHGIDFAFRMGLNSGEVVVGKIGDDLRMDYTAAGHCVGLAQRMETLAEAGSCYLTDAVAREAGGYFEFEDLGDFQIKGVGAAVRVHKLVGIGQARTRFDVSRSRGLTRFVGRSGDVATLESALERARRGHGAVLGVIAEAGTGKSRLCFEFLESCKAAGYPVVEGRAVAHGKNVPLIPVLEIFRGYFGVGERDDPREAREKIAGRLLLLDDSFREVLPVLFEFLGVADPARPAPRMEPEARQRRLFGVVRGLLQLNSEQRPGIILVEDLHWLDDSSETWIREWVDAVAGTHNLLLVNSRPEYRSEWTQRTHYQQLSLAPLGPEAIRELLEALLGSDPSIAGLGAAIHQRTGGNPFFAEEVVRSLLESGQLVGSAGAYRLEGPLESLRVPDSVQVLLASRIDRLREREKHLLQTAAVIGKRFRETVLERVCGLSSPELAEALALLRDAEFIYEQSLYPVAEYAFKHPLTQEVALGSQLHDARRRIHAGVARAIEEFDADRLDEQAAELANHWEQAAEPALAASWHARAARWAMDSATDDAYRHWERVRALSEGDADRVGLLGDAYIALVNLGWRAGFSPADAKRRFESGRRLFQRSGDRRSHALLCANYMLTGGVHCSERVACYEEAVRIARELGDVELLIAVRVAIYPQLYSGRLADALESANEAISLIETHGWTGQSPFFFSPDSWIHCARGNVRALLGDVEGAIADLDRGAEIVQTRDDFDRLLVQMSRVNVEFAIGDREALLEAARRCFEYARAVGGIANLRMASGSLGRVLASLGQTSEALELLESSQGLMTENEHYLVSDGYPSVLQESGRPERALEVARENVAYCVRYGIVFSELWTQTELARVAAANGQREEATAAIARADRLALETGCAIRKGAIRESAAAVAACFGEHDEARRELARAERDYRDAGALGHADRVAGLLAG